MAQRIIALAVAVLSALQWLWSMLQGRKPKLRLPSHRLERISDKALAEILALFNPREPAEGLEQRRKDSLFVHAITTALEDRALTAAQICSLFKYNYTTGADYELRRYFGWDQALKEAAEAADENASRPSPELAPRPTLPPISAANFEVLRRELAGLTIAEAHVCVREWSERYSLTLAQRGELIAVAKSGDPKVTHDCVPIRMAVRNQFQVSEPEQPVVPGPSRMDSAV